MSERKIKTIKLQGKDYVQVAERLRAIHEDYDNFDIVTTFTVNETAVIFTATLTIRDKDKQRVFTGHSYGKLGGAKALEKQETIAVGRALAFAGYHADGEIASADEMQEYGKEVDQEVLTDSIMQIMDAKDVADLEQVYKGLPVEIRRHKDIIEAGKKRKKELTEVNAEE